MKVWSWREAIQKSGLSSNTKLVLLNLSIYMNDKGESCFPSIGTQVKDTGLSERSVYSAISVATSSGFLIKTKKYHSNKVHNEYRAAFPNYAANEHYGVIPKTVKPENEEVKKAAIKAVSNALKANKLAKQPCLVCGDADVVAHHHDYNDRLNVHWLCRTHHRHLLLLEKSGNVATQLPLHHVQGREEGTPAPRAGVPLHHVHPNTPVELSNIKDVTNVTSKKAKTSAQQKEVFEKEFWPNYPRQRRGNKDKAYKAFVTACTRDTIKNILTGLAHYTQSQEVAKGFAKGAAAWLNDDRWQNDYQPIQGEQKNENFDNAARDLAAQYLQQGHDSGEFDIPPPGQH